MTLKKMDYLIVKLNGLSMHPFLQDNDVVIVSNNNPKLEIGQCVLIDQKVHRYIDNFKVKGDRLMYLDDLKENVFPKLLGRVVRKKNNYFIVSNYDHILLKLMSKLISLFSRLNTEKQFGRKLIVFSIVILASFHRILENILVRKINL